MPRIFPLREICVWPSRAASTVIYCTSLTRMPVEQMVSIKSANRGVIVNMNEITSMDLETCALSDGSVLPVKQKDRAVIRKQYSDFLFHELHLMAASKRREKP